jgi:hypothetical protein
LQSTVNRLSFSTLVWLGFTLVNSGATAQTISDRIYDVSRKPGTPVIFGVLGEPIPLSVDELTKQSDLVVETRLSRLDTYVNADDTAIYTDFEMLPIRILAGNVPVAIPLMLRTYGGEVVREGVTIRAENHDSEQLKESALYLLFLKHLGPDPTVYKLYNVGAFELSNDTARPLARGGADLYRDFSTTYEDVIARVMKSARGK